MIRNRSQTFRSIELLFRIKGRYFSLHFIKKELSIATLHRNITLRKEKKKETSRLNRQLIKIRGTPTLFEETFSKKEISSKKHIQSDPETCPDRLNVNFTRTCLSDQTLRLYLHFSYSIKTITRVSCCAIRRAEERKRKKKKKGVWSLEGKRKIVKHFLIPIYVSIVFTKLY